MREIPPPPFGTLKQWGERLNSFLISTKDLLTFKTDNATAYRNGVMLWDDTNNYPVVSIDGVWTPLGIGGGTNQGSYGMFYDTTNQTATDVDTPYGVSWNSTAYSNNIAIDGTDATKINFTKGGTYHITFSATIHSENASAKHIYFFPRIDGTDIDGSTMMHSLDTNNNRKVVTRAGMFEIDSGSYLQTMWATDDTDLDMHPVTGLSFAPDIPSATITIVEVTA